MPAAGEPAATAAAPSSGGGTADLVLMAALLAAVTTAYLIGGHLARDWPGFARALVEVGFVGLGQFGVALAMLVIVARGYRRKSLQGETTRARLAVLVGACSGAGMGVQLVTFLLLMGVDKFTYSNLQFVGLWNISLATLLVLAHHFGERSRSAAAALRDIEVGRLALERELASARLQLLQAQVEPHFIFNALANVRRLLRTDAAAARALLTNLLRYLEEALPRLREEHTTLGREAELVRAFLAVHQVRMGARLQSVIDVPADLASQSVPPMVLLTLVENALKHGLQPLVDGGSLTIRARADGARLTLSVADTGRGMGSGSGHGTGLANVRARLKSMYGAAASLSLAVNEPRGVVATVMLPREAA